MQKTASASNIFILFPLIFEFLLWLIWALNIIPNGNIAPFSTHYFIYQNFCCRKCCKTVCGMVSSGFGVIAFPFEPCTRFVLFLTIRAYRKYEAIPCLTQEHPYKLFFHLLIIHTQEDDFQNHYVDTALRCINYLCVRYVL